MKLLIALGQSAFEWTWETSIYATLLIVLVFALQKVLAKWLTPRLRYTLSLLVLIRLLLPTTPSSVLSSKPGSVGRQTHEAGGRSARRRSVNGGCNFGPAARCLSAAGAGRRVRSASLCPGCLASFGLPAACACCFWRRGALGNGIA